MTDLDKLRAAGLSEDVRRAVEDAYRDALAKGEADPFRLLTIMCEKAAAAESWTRLATDHYASSLAAKSGDS